MNDDPRFDQDVRSVLAGMAPSQGPRDLLDDVFLSTGPMRPRPRWLALIKEPPMRTSSGLAVGSPTVRLATVAILSAILLMATLAAVGIGARVLSADVSVPPFGPARNGPLLYSAGADIYLADPDGSNPRAIITGTTFDQVPWFSPGGTKIAFGRGSELTRALMVANADGSGVTKLLHPGDWWAEFLPGDAQMVVTRPVDGTVRMSIIDVATGATVRDFDLGAVEADWWVMPRPPDGHELVLRGIPAGQADERGLYGVSLDGADLRPIGATSAVSDDQWVFLDPSISPDGSTVAYWDWAPEDGAPSSDAFLHLRDLNTGEELPVPFDRHGLRPLYTPDGTMLLYEGSTDDDALHQLFMVPVDGSRPAKPIGPPFPGDNDHYFNFSPDGTKAYLVQAGVTTLIDLESGSTTDLTGDAPEVGGWQRLAP